MNYILIVFLTLVFLIPLITMIVKGHFFKSLFISAFQGAAALLAVKALGLITGVSIAINWYTAITTVFLGIPACIAMLVLNIIF